ncbi:DUF2780 domain-containing protein [Pseudocolwellia agarivorans]|uniref:DUF2780 domain-containing protein n=1 Tax=Pseudocolwellia agarivorans TaxID=1911682 RepID=UPI0009861096|nr:DUF2780 domain-containing protein [Pseudocolwellia agarivorans]
MKLRTILVSSLLVTTTFSASAFDFLDTIKEAFGMGEKQSTEQVQSAAGAKEKVEDAKEEAAQTSNDLVGYAAEQLGLSKEMTSGALGALFKVAKDNLGDNFSSISEAIPGVENYIQNAPEAAKSSLGGLASSLGKGSEEGQAALSLGYLDSAFKKLGIPKETVLPLVDTVTSYLEQNNYGTAAAMLKKGVNFL